MDSVKSALESIGRMWAALKATQKVVLSASAAAMVLLLVWGSASSVPAMVRVAGPELDANKRQEILAKFQERNQKHEVRGAEIYVPKEDADRVVLELAGEGTMNTSGVWKFLEQSNIFDTKWDKEKKLQIAYQNRLEGMIRSIESVRSATVLINPGSTNFALGFAGPKPSASVTVDLKEGFSLSRKNVQAIAGLVARAVSGVEEDQVHIVDTKGNAYRMPRFDSAAGIANDIRDLERTIEQDILGQLKAGFVHYPGASFVVRVQVKKSSSSTEEVKHDRPIVIETDEDKTVRKGSSPAPSGVRKGEPEPPTLPETPSREEETTTRLHEKSVTGTKRTTEQNPAGEIEKVRVGVQIPVEVGPDNREMVEAEKRLAGLREIAMNAAGPPARNEDVSVQFIPMKRPEALAIVPPTDRTFDWFSANASKAALFGLAIAALFVMMRVAQTAMARDSVEEIQSLTTALTETGEAAVDGGLPAETEFGRLKQNVQEMVGRNPQGVAASLKSFMSGR